ncbi:4506_t:CDS:10, partial [Ambispora leptoticha]
MAAANQDFDIPTQLKDGIRAFMLDAHNPINGTDSQAIELCHQSCNLLDAGNLVNTLQQIVTWLQSNPNEVITIFWENFDKILTSRFMSAYQSSGIMSYVYPQQDATSAWPTLQSMINSGKRVVNFIDVGADQSVPWLMAEYNYVFETPFDNSDPNGWQCTVDRPKNQPRNMYVLNHFLSGKLPASITNGQDIEFPQHDVANTTNSQSLQQHAAACKATFGKTPNFVAVDFYEIGANNQNVFSVVANLNNVSYVPKQLGNTVTANGGSNNGSSSSDVDSLRVSIKFSQTMMTLGVVAMFVVLKRENNNNADSMASLSFINEEEVVPTSKAPSTIASEKLLEKLLGDISDNDILEIKDSETVDDPITASSSTLNTTAAVEENEFVREILAKGMDLREHAQNIETELYAAERDHESEYVNQTRNFVNLHDEIQSCDKILEKMENMLSVFQKDLGNISSEIQSLQEKSLTMSIKLKNRTAVEEQLSAVLDGIVIPPPMIKKITEGEVDETWLAYLNELNRKMIYVTKNQDKEFVAFKDVGPELEKLRLKAVEKIRDFLLKKIKSLRIPNTNVQILQQSVFLKYKELHQFVMEQYPEVAIEIRQTYVNTMKWYFYNHFERYNRGLQSLQSPIGDKLDLMGYDENVKKGGLFGTTRIALQDKTSIFALGDRIDTLRSQDAGVILVHVAENKNLRYPVEALFRSFNLTFIDNASSEYLFLLEFFAKDDKPAVDMVRDLFAEIFDSTIKLGLATAKENVEHSYDVVGILLCIRLNTQFALELQRRRVPALESYTNQINMLLWPRLKTIMDRHIESVKKAKNKLVARDVHPHYISRRYAEFAASILILNDEYNDPPLKDSLTRLQNEFTALLDKMSLEFEERKNRYIFLINNYDLVITILSENGGKALDPEINCFKELLNSKISGYVEEELHPYFGGLIKFVKKAQEIKDIGTISLDFSNTWRQSITAINTSVIQNFSNFTNGTFILHAVLGQLIIYYTQFFNYLEARIQKDDDRGEEDGGNRGNNNRGSNDRMMMKLRHQPVDVQTVTAEIKR